MIWLSSDENFPDWLIEGLMPAYFTIAGALWNRLMSPISETICRAEDVPDAGDGEDERLDLLDALAYLRLHLLGLPFDEVNLVYEQLYLERQGGSRHPHPA